MGTAVKEKKEKVRKPNKPIKLEIEKKKFASLIKSHVDYSAKYEFGNLLSGIFFQVKDGILTMASTDGNRLLVTDVEMLELDTNFEPVVYNGVYLSNIKFAKGINCPSGCPDSLEITLADDEMTIFDMFNRFTYKVPSMQGQYPKYEQLINIPDPEATQTYALNIRYLQDLKNLHYNERTGIVKVMFNKESNLKPIFAETDNGEGIKQRALIMPVQIRG